MVLNTFATRFKRQKFLKGCEDIGAVGNTIINTEDKPPSGKSRDLFSLEKDKGYKPFLYNNYWVCIQRSIKYKN